VIISNRLHFGGELDYVLDPEILIFTSVDEGQLYVKRLSTNSYEVFCGWATRFWCGSRNVYRIYYYCGIGYGDCVSLADNSKCRQNSGYISWAVGSLTNKTIRFGYWCKSGSGSRNF